MTKKRWHISLVSLMRTFLNSTVLCCTLLYSAVLCFNIPCFRLLCSPLSCPLLSLCVWKKFSRLKKIFLKKVSKKVWKSSKIFSQNVTKSFQFCENSFERFKNKCEEFRKIDFFFHTTFWEKSLERLKKKFYKKVSNTSLHHWWVLNEDSTILYCTPFIMCVKTPPKNVMDETEGVNDVDMTENRDIPVHPWP